MKASATFGYSWTLPDNWRFVPTAPFWSVPPAPSIDASVAQTDDELSVLAVITDMAIPRASGEVGKKPKAYDDLVEIGRNHLRNYGVESASAQPVSMLGMEGAQVTGEQGARNISVRSFYRGNRRFQFTCFDRRRGPEWRCASAFVSFRIDDVPSDPPGSDTPVVRHLRDDRFGFAFDAPDDSWLSIGPRTGFGGAAFTWSWANQGRQIDVQALDLRRLPRPIAAAELARKVADENRKPGASVVEKEGELAGQRCHHIEIDAPNGRKRDFYVLVDGDTMFSILVSQLTRDAGLLEAVKNGFRVARSAPAQKRP